MDVKYSGLLAELFAMNVIDRRDKEELESIESSTCRIERLLSMLSRTSSDQWEQFLVALDVTGQRHLADMIRGKQTEEFPGFSNFCSLVHQHLSDIISLTMDFQYNTACTNKKYSPLSLQNDGRKYPVIFIGPIVAHYQFVWPHAV
jgi:hypothetical protein